MHLAALASNRAPRSTPKVGDPFAKIPFVGRRFPPLNDRQREVLSWIGDGCPDGVWASSVYKKTAYGLAERGLVRVDRRPNSWTATITESGRHYLEHSEFPRSNDGTVQATRRPLRAPSTTTRVEVSPEDLLSRLQAAGGRLALADPSDAERAAYRSAIHRALSERLVPDGMALRHSGRDKGDLVIRLVDRAAEPAPPEPLPPIAIPDAINPDSELLALLVSDSSLLDVSDGARDRALLVAQAIHVECVRREYDIELSADREITFEITAEASRFQATLREELDRRDLPDDERLAAVKYKWQRVPSTVRDVPSGRLKLQLGKGYGSTFWADRKRWTLEQRLPHFFAELSRQASQRAAARLRDEVARQERRQAWEEAIPRAKHAYVDHLNRERLIAQVGRSQEASAIRAYCDRLEAQLAETNEPEAQRELTRWIEWSRAEADRTDPLTKWTNLRYVEPEEVRPGDFASFMPRGLSAYSPPT